MLAEFADQVPDRTPADLAEELATRLPHMPVPTQGLLLTALIKLRMHAPEDRGLERLVTETFQQYSANANPDIQQRAVEYLELSYMADNPVVRDALFAPMPEWTEQRPLFPGSAAQDGSAEVSAAPAPTSPTGAVASDADSAAKGAAGSSTPAADEATAERSGASVGETEVVPTPAALLRNGDRDGAAAAPCAASASAASPAAEGETLSQSAPGVMPVTHRTLSLWRHWISVSARTDALSIIHITPCRGNACQCICNVQQSFWFCTRSPTSAACLFGTVHQCSPNVICCSHGITAAACPVFL